MKKMLFALLALLLLLPFAAFWAAKNYLQDLDLPLHEGFPLEAHEQTVLCVFAHPDDEILLAGTLHLMAQQGRRVVGLYLTRGEAGPTGDLVPRQQLGAARSQELEQAGQVLGYHALQILDFGDGQLPQTDSAQMVQAIAQAIAQHRPQVLLTYDDRVGLYGHPDHVAAARYTKQVFLQGQARPDFPVKRLFQATLGQNTVKAALKLAPGFKNRYPTEPGKGLPLPHFAVRITPAGTAKMAALQAHRTQASVFDKLMPFYKSLPQWLYFRLFDREYYAEVKATGQPQ